MSQRFCCFGSMFLLSGFTYAQNVPDKLWGEYQLKCFKKARPVISFFGIFCEIVSKLEKFSLNFWNFNLFPSMPSVATNDRKQNKRHNIVLNKLKLNSGHKPEPLFLEFSWGQHIFGILKKCKKRVTWVL